MRRFSRGSARPKRAFDWEGSLAANTLVPANSLSNFYIVNPSTVRDNYTDPTLVKTRLQLALVNISTGSPAFGAWGVIEWPDINDNPPAAGESPDPLLRPSMDWIMHNFYSVPFAGTASVLIYPGGNSTVADSKAKRRLGNEKGILFVISTGIASADVRFQAGARCLLQEK